jgi:hypothetical protein
MPSLPAKIRELGPSESLKSFIDLAWTLNQRDPLWVPPLRMTVETVLDRKKHPFHKHAEVAYFLAERGGKAVGRVAAIVNHLHNERWSDRVGFFGFFECEDDDVTARALLDAARAWLRGRRMEVMRGPTNFSTNEESSSPGVLIDGFDTPPVVQMSHNPRYYERLMEAAGMEKAKDLIAFWMEGDIPDRLVRGFDRALKRQKAVIRPLNLKRFRQEVDILKGIYNSAWSENWGFVPMTDDEFEHMAKEFRPVVDPDLCLIAEIDGEPVGFSLALPNLNEAIRHIPNGRLLPFGIFKFLWYRRKIATARVITLGFKPAYQHLGLGGAFYLRTWETGVRKGYPQGEASWVLEDNHEMMRALERIGSKPYKRYRLYDAAL